MHCGTAYIIHRRGASALLGLDYQGNAKTFKAWTGHRTGSTFFYMYAANLNTINTRHRSLARKNLILANEEEKDIKLHSQTPPKKKDAFL